MSASETREGTRNVAEGHEGACWQVGMLSASETREGTRGQGDTGTRGTPLRGQGDTGTW